MPDSRRKEITAFLRAHGLRVTPQRRAIWAAFEEGRAGHLSADEVLRRARAELPELSRGTVYNALGELVAAGLLTTVAGDGAQLYDPNPQPHHHFRCSGCNELFDVQLKGLERLTPIEPGFRAHRTQVLLEGTCPGCSAPAAG